MTNNIVSNPVFTAQAAMDAMPRVTPAALTAQRLALTYGGGGTSTHALRGVDFSVGVGGPEAVAIMGPSGSGKSSLLHVLAGILTPDSGNVMWRGQDIATMKDAERTRLRRTDFGFVFQSGQLLPELSASENVMIPLLLAKTARSEAQRRSHAMLTALGLGGMYDKRPGQLSGGQAQRVAIARALVTGPGLVFADEPTGALDRNTGASVLELLTQQTLSRGASLVVVTHDPEVARACSRTVYLEDGVIVDTSVPIGQNQQPNNQHPAYGTQHPAYGTQHPAQGGQTMQHSQGGQAVQGGQHAYPAAQPAPQPAPQQTIVQNPLAASYERGQR